MDDRLQEDVKSLAQSAVAHAQQQFNFRLDFTPGSIQFVEQILGTIYHQVPHSRVSRLFKPRTAFEELARIANVYGAYIGEVLRQLCGGVWETTEVCGCENILLLRIASDFTLMPTTRTWNRLTMGASENVLRYFNRTLERAAALAKEPARASASATP